MTTYDPGHGLTSKQAWSQAHIQRCPSCGAWECLSNLDALMRYAPGYVAPAFCKHLSHDQHTKGEAA